MMTDDREVLLEKINFEQYAEDTEPRHPLAEMSLNEVKAHIAQLEQEYAGYTDLRYEYNYKALKYGARMAWYDLTGVASPLMKALK